MNIDLDDTNLLIYPDTVGNYSLFVLGKSIASYAYKAVDLEVVCGVNSQNIQLVDAEAATINVVKNQDGDFELILTTNETESLFTEEYTDQCLIEVYHITDSDGNDFANDTDLYAILNLDSRNGSSVEFNSTYTGDGNETEVTYEFQIIAEAAGGNMISKNITVNLVVCGYESVTLAEDGDGVAGELQITDYIDNTGSTQATNVSSLFLSNDTDCPLIDFKLKPADWNETVGFDSVDYTDDNVDLTDEEMVTSTITEQTTDFLIVGKTTSGLLTPKDVTVRILPACVPENQTITVVDATALEMTHDKNQGVITIVNETDLDMMFNMSNLDACLIDNYRVVHADNSSEILEGEDAYALFAVDETDGLSILLNTDLAAQDGLTRLLEFNYAIEASNAGGSTSYKDLSINITVCGYETITVNDTNINTTDFTDFAIEVVGTAQEVDISEWFTSNDTDCPVVLSIVSETDLGDTYLIDSDVLELNPITLGSLPFAIQADTIGEVTDSVNVTYTVTCGPDS